MYFLLINFGLPLHFIIEFTVLPFLGIRTVNLWVWRLMARIWWRLSVRWVHGLTNYTDAKANCRHLKILTCREVFIRVYRLELYSQSCRYCRPSCSFVNCCSSNLLFCSTLPPPPSLCKSDTTLKQCVMWGGGYRVLVLRQINTCCKVPLQVNFFRWRHFALPSMSLIYGGNVWQKINL